MGSGVLRPSWEGWGPAGWAPGSLCPLPAVHMSLGSYFRPGSQPLLEVFSLCRAIEDSRPE